MEDAYTILAGKLGYPGSDRLRRILQKLMNQDEASLVASLPAPVNEVSSKLGKPVDETNRMLEALFNKGVVFVTSKGYQFARSMTQLHDATASDRRLDPIYGKELLQLWFEFGEKEWFRDWAKSAQEKGHALWRVIPARRAIAPQERVVPAEDINMILEKASLFAVVPCPCRRVAGRCSRPEDVCLQLNRGAEYAVSRGTGRQLSREEAMEVMETAEDAGLIHTVRNSAEVASVICNCCTDCCLVLYPLMKYGGLDTGMAKSRFEAKVDQSQCTGCQDCVERCQFDAIEMVRVAGQKKMKAQVNPDKCYGCGLCAVKCKTTAIKLVEARPPEYIPA